MRTPEEELDQLRAQDLHRSLRFLDSGTGRLVEYEGRPLLNFSSNDYLGLAAHPQLSAAAAAALDDFGSGAGASRLIYGGSQPHHDLERATADFLDKEAALTFANGYTAALGVLGALAGRGDTVILDKRSHASLIDGARLCGATVRVFPHNHLDKLQRLLESSYTEAGDDARVIVVTESVFSMDGDTCPLPEIVELKDRYGALLLLDEAHAFGVLGERGRGLASELNLNDRIDLQLLTFGKAAGSAGGCVAGGQAWIELIANRARSFIYSTSPPPAQAAAALAGLNLIGSPEGDALRQQLQRNREMLAAALDLPLPAAAIVPVVLAEEALALQAAQDLADSGMLVPAIRYPTVARNSARLRISLSAAHTTSDIERLSSTLRELDIDPQQLS